MNGFGILPKLNLHTTRITRHAMFQDQNQQLHEPRTASHKICTHVNFNWKCHCNFVVCEALQLPPILQTTLPLCYDGLAQIHAGTKRVWIPFWPPALLWQRLSMSIWKWRNRQFQTINLEFGNFVQHYRQDCVTRVAEGVLFSQLLRCHFSKQSHSSISSESKHLTWHLCWCKFLEWCWHIHTQTKYKTSRAKV